MPRDALLSTPFRYWCLANLVELPYWTIACSITARTTEILASVEGVVNEKKSLCFQK
jgi:hypothetical protein